MLAGGAARGIWIKTGGLWFVVCGLWHRSTYPRRQQVVKRWPAVQTISLKNALKEAIETEWKL